MTTLDLSDLDNLNREYSPSSCIDDINIYIQQYVQQSKVAKTLAMQSKTLHCDLSYGKKTTQGLDIFLPTSKSKKKLMVYIHGGYWQELSKEESCFAATNFQRKGYHFAVIDYTLAPNATMHEIVEENRQAITWLYNNASKYGYHSEEIYVSGSSAGAHLATLMFQTKWADYIPHYTGNIIKGLCAVSGIYDLQPLVPSYVNDPIKMDIIEAKANSPLFQKLPKPTPIIIAYGNNETHEFKRQSKAMADLFVKNGFKVHFKEIEKRNHFDVITDLSDKTSWLSQHTLALMK